MNFTKACIAVLVFSLSCTSCLSAYADAVTIDSISVENKITLNGSINYEELGVSTGDYEASPYYPAGISLTCTDADGTVVYVDQTQAADDGLFSFVFDVTDIDNTELKAIINTPFGEMAEQTFVYENKSIEILNKEFSSLDEDEALEFLKLNAPKLGITTLYLEALEDKNDIISEFKAAYSKAVVAGLLRADAPAETIIACIDAEDNNLGQSYYLWSERTADCSPEEVIALVDALSDLKPENASAFEEDLYEDYITYFFKTTQYYADYAHVFDNEYNLFDLSEEQLSAYEELGTNQSKALAQLYNINKSSPIATAEELKTTVDDAIKNAKENDEPTKNDSKPGRKNYSSGLGGVTLPSAVEQPKTTFSDVSAAAWYAPAIEALAAKGIVNGKGNGTFEPGANVTRAEFAQMLYKMLELTPEPGTGFEDVADTDWYSNAVNTLYANEIVNGMGAEFGVNLTITRQDMAVMLYNAAKFDGIELQGSKQPADTDDISDYAKEGVFALLANGILNGYEDESFNPLNNLSRAEAAQALYSFINHREG